MPFHTSQDSVRRGRVIQGRFVAGAPRLPVPGAAGTVQRQANGHAQPLPPGLVRMGGGGRPLPDGVRQKMETFFKADFSDVRVHVGSEAPAIGALAFTLGSSLYFAPGQYNPETPHGQQLLGHELTHVLQQRAGRVRNPFGSGIAVVQDPSLEAEADRMGMRAAMHVVAPVIPLRAAQAKRPVGAEKSLASLQFNAMQLARDYPPMSNAQAVRQAELSANLWNNGGQPHPGNYGNQGGEYITAGQIATLKDKWRNKANLHGFERRASDSMSAIGSNVDLKLADPNEDFSRFNYHVAVDVQEVKKVSAKTKRKIRNQIKEARDAGTTVSRSLISALK